LNGSAVAGPAEHAGYAVERERGALIVALPSVIVAVVSLLHSHTTLYDAAAARPDAQAFAGRGAAYRMTIAGTDVVVRHYRRGGAVARVLHDEYLRLGEPRPLRELHASISARARGVDTPEVVAAIAYLAGPLYRADLATRFVPGSRDLATVTFGKGLDDLANDRTRERTRAPARARVRVREREDEEARAAAWHAAGSLVRTAFDAGVEHADLNLRNILISPPAGAPRALLLDLDRAVVHAKPLRAAVRSAMIARLHRSRAKLEKLAGEETGAEELAAFRAGLGDVGA
jgi:3-deoxy-D-manno-octulosonic acid kinase